jgi:signal transduction histidine kinase
MHLFRNIIIATTTVAVLIASVFIYVSSTTFSANLENEVLTRYEHYVRSLGVSLTHSSANATAISQQQQDIRETVANLQPPHEVSFIRVINVSNGRLIASTEQTAETATVPRVPRAIDGEVRVVGDNNGGNTFNLTYGGMNDRLVWVRVQADEIRAAALVHAIQQSIIVVAFIGLVVSGMYWVQRAYFQRPLQRLVVQLRAAWRERRDDEEAQGVDEEEDELASDTATNTAELLEAVRSIADQIRETLIRDRNVSKMKSDFITTTAHQLRTPLSGLNWALETMLNDSKNELHDSHRVIVERALEKTNELIGIVGTLLNAASLEEGKFGYHLEEADLYELISSTIEEEQPKTENWGVELAFETDEDEYPTVRVDTERIRWVLRNLIENALRYSEEGQTVTVSLTQTGDYLQVAVTDRGIGIPPKDKDHIFDKFYRAKNAVEKRNEGSGLGLYIARNIINYHNGKIWFESEMGEGTTFYFTIPVKQSASSLEQNGDDLYQNGL